MRTDRSTSVIVSVIFAVLINMGIICYAASGNINTTPQDDSEELKNKTRGVMFKHPGWGWQQDTNKTETGDQKAQNKTGEPESSAMDLQKKNALPEFERHSNRTGPKVEYSEGVQGENNENDRVIQTQISTGQSKSGPVPVEGTQTSQLPKFEPVTSKRGPVATNN